MSLCLSFLHQTSLISCAPNNPIFPPLYSVFPSVSFPLFSVFLPAYLLPSPSPLSSVYLTEWSHYSAVLIHHRFSLLICAALINTHTHCLCFKWCDIQQPTHFYFITQLFSRLTWWWKKRRGRGGRKRRVVAGRCEGGRRGGVREIIERHLCLLTAELNVSVYLSVEKEKSNRNEQICFWAHVLLFGFGFICSEVQYFSKNWSLNTIKSKSLKRSVFFCWAVAGSKPGSHQDEITGISPRKSFVFPNSLTRSEGERKRELLVNEAAFSCFFYHLWKTVSPNLASRRGRFSPKPLFPGEPCLLWFWVRQWWPQARTAARTRLAGLSCCSGH